MPVEAMSEDIDTVRLLAFLGYAPSVQQLAAEAPPPLTAPTCDRELDSWHYLRNAFGNEANVRAAFAVAAHIVRFVDRVSQLKCLPKRPQIGANMLSIAKWCVDRTPVKLIFRNLRFFQDWAS